MNRRFIFDKINTTMFIVGIVMLVLGYLIMSLGDIVWSPIILVIAYLVVFPAAVVWGVVTGRKKTEEKDSQPINQSTVSGKTKKLK